MPIGDLLAQITGEPSPTQPLPPAFPKRKANEELSKPADKIQRTAHLPPASRPLLNQQQKQSPSAVNSSMANMKLGPNGKSGARPSPISNPKNGQTVQPPTPSTNAPPKKGSFAEIMARGKAAQATHGQIGKIQHKKIEKQPTKREREEAKAQKMQNLQKNMGKGGKFRGAVEGAIAGVKKNGTGKGKTKGAPEPEVKKIKKAASATTGYAGTARPKPGAMSRPSASSSSGRNKYRDERRGYGSSRRDEYLSEDEEEEEDDEEEEEDGYASDASSDMEAAAFEVDEEEELASKIARKEDAEALAEENRLKREKLERKRKMQALAKAKSRR